MSRLSKICNSRLSHSVVSSRLMFLVPEEGSQQPPVPVYTCKASNQANTVEEGVEMRYVEEGGALGGDPGE